MFIIGQCSIYNLYYESHDISNSGLFDEVYKNPWLHLLGKVEVVPQIFFVDFDNNFELLFFERFVEINT